MAAAFRCQVGEYRSLTAYEKLGSLISAAATAGFATHHTKQTEAWEEELRLIGETASELLAQLPERLCLVALFEYEIPRCGKRPDLVIIAHDVIFVIEFKVGGDSICEDVWQVSSYA